MTLLVIFFAAMAAGLMVVGFANLLPSQTRVMKRRLAVLQTGAMSYRELQEQRRRQAKREQFETLLDEGAPELGLAAGMYERLKYNVVHLDLPQDRRSGSRGASVRLRGRTIRALPGAGAR